MKNKPTINKKKDSPSNAINRSNPMIIGGFVLSVISIGLLGFVIKTKLF